jgi:hypothetical protein
MGLLDKAKFWKKGEEDLGDLSDLGDFGMGDTHAGEPLPDAGAGGMGGPGQLPSLDSGPEDMPGGPIHKEEVHPTQASMDMSDQLGLKPAEPSPTATAHPPTMQAAPMGPPPAQPMPGAGHDIGDLAKDIEIIHAKLDAIKSSLDSINQRLATLERMAAPEGKTRYTW